MAPPSLNCNIWGFYIFNTSVTDSFMFYVLDDLDIQQTVSKTTLSYLIFTFFFLKPCFEFLTSVSYLGTKKADVPSVI